MPHYKCHILGLQELRSGLKTTFNFPTLAETYRIAPLDIVGQRQRRLNSTAA